MLLTPPTTHALRIYAQQMQQTHRMTPDRDAKSAISGRDLPLPKLNAGNSSDLSADINGDGQVGPIDLGMLLGAWGVCP